MSDMVLIADGNAERGRRIATACRSLGIATRVVTHGAAALETALADKPTAMVAQVDLPLIDGTRLAEILHANPHTRAISMLFIDDGQADATASRGSRGRLVPGHSDPETTAHLIKAMLHKRRPDPAAGSTPAEPGVEGKLAQIALSELIELFHVNRKTGVIELRQGGGRRAATGRIHLRDGDVIQARSGGVDGEKALYRLLGWRRGTFAFRETAVDDRAAIDRPTRALLREAQRQAEEWERLESELPARHARVTLKVARASLPNVLHPLTQEVLLALELSSRVQEVLDRCSYPDYQVLRTLQTLSARGMIELHADAAGREASVGGLMAPTTAARLRDWLEQGQPRGVAPPDAKVVLIAWQPEVRSALVSLLARLPGVEALPRGETPGVWPAARIPIDEDVVIELIDVPSELRFAPVWPLAVHGALATLFVHGGDVEASVGALGAVVQQVTSRPRARCFHVLLQEKERGGVDVLRERLALFDDRNVVALAPERPDEAAASLRDLLALLVP